MADWNWLKNNLLLAKIKSNSFFLQNLSNCIFDVGELLKCASNINDYSIDGIINFINNNEVIEINLDKLNDLPSHEKVDRFNFEGDLTRLWQNNFSKIFKFFTRQNLENDAVDLFLGLPIIHGKIKNDIFYAPLFFIKVQIKKSNNWKDILIYLKHSEIYLNPFILSIVANCNNVMYEEYSHTYIDVNKALTIFKNLGVSIKLPVTNEIVPFKIKTKVDIDSNEKNHKNSLINNILLGMFDVSGNKLFQDFTEILNSDPKSLSTIFANKRDLLFDKMKFESEFELSKINLITPLDIYQQYSVAYAYDGDIVIEGPPGTGKSETILNILVNIVFSKKRVLFVSEKTTALQIVYNRLAEFKYLSLYIPDNENPDFFYSQFSNFESYFSKNYNEESISFTKPDFNNLFLSNVYKSCKVINKIFESKISSGNNYYQFLYLITNFKVIDVDFISAIDPREFDKWLIKYSDQKWAKLHENYRLLIEKIDKNIGINQFAFFYKFYKSKVFSIKKLISAIDFFLKNKRLKIPKFKKASRCSEEAVTLSKKVLLYFEEYEKLSLYNDITTYKKIKTNIEKNVQGNSFVYFASWYIQEFSNNILDKLELLEKNVDDSWTQYEILIKQYIEANKRYLKSIMLSNFLQLYKTDKYSLLEMTRQNRLSKRPDIVSFFKKNYSLISKLFPIHIVSFETAAKILENKKDLYDYVVIDEASQTFLERALPILYRAKKYIIAGDTKQLQPTGFFQNRKIDSDADFFSENDESFSSDANEAINAISLIHFFKERARLVSLLKFHYRCDNGQLIAFTNSHIYNNELIFLDKAIKSDKVFVVHDVQNGQWANQKNLAEALEVVKRVEELTKTDWYAKSIGIITLNKNQCELIESHLSRLANPKIEEWKNRYTKNGEFIGLFVKNIENVQGDERDCIIFSIGYDDNVFSYGPISKRGGENRLNVAITRAKKRIEIFKSSPAKSYAGWNSQNKGSKLFAEYLLYCEQQSNSAIECDKSLVTNFSNMVAETGNLFNSDFQDEIHSNMKKYIMKIFSEKFEIKENVVLGSYFFDFVFLKEGNALLAVNCGTMNFKDKKDFTEKYIYKNIFLKKRGWKHLFVWYNEWFVNKKNVLIKISKYLEEYL